LPVQITADAGPNAETDVDAGVLKAASNTMTAFWQQLCGIAATLQQQGEKTNAIASNLIYTMGLVRKNSKFNDKKKIRIYD
jgi:hypothetical protein